MVNEFSGKLIASGLRIGIVVARFNSFITERLLEAAVDTIIRHGGDQSAIDVIRVPGSFEIPLACKRVIETRRVDAVIALGTVIRGSTSHYDLVCSEVAKGVGSLGLSHSIPVIFGVVTTDTIEQAIERAGTKAGNKGADSALAAIEMANLLREL